ncbi:non-canonical purine NTP pyrophosphatase [Candidatus Pelagibacter sp.]|nr:non-canonical purine NTP pyrophosphatase [Candidatus Pelagibacter sp.]|tara:strand:+ start:243 stop:845 length:603 start_codon:yes stop_codon:yes gene_type:complete
MLNKKITKLLVGTNNKGKLREISDLLPKNIEIYSPEDFNVKSPVENGKSFLENSLIKAKYFSKKAKMICLADDSGLEVDILDKNPGIFSARWGGKKNDFSKAMEKVFREIAKKDENWKLKKIRARFICALTVYWPDGNLKNSIGKIEGHISHKKLGKNGFGYDPIFIPTGKKLTFGQMTSKFKYKIDHRYKAYQKIKKFF